MNQDKAQAIANATATLSPEEARRAEAMVLDRAGSLTAGGLRSAIRRAVKAKKRREHAARRARVERWAEHSGNAGLAGRELPPAQVLAADQRVSAWAKELRKAGLEGDMDVLRARAYLDILLGMDSRPPDSAADGQSTPGQGEPQKPSPGGPAGTIPPGFAARVNLTIPAATVLDLADRPGEMDGIGPIDPDPEANT